MYSTTRNLPFEATWVNLEDATLSEGSQTERKTMQDLTYTWKLKTLHD